jgi:pimeloyl-[acyl-carrier protein] methyl ester esterase
MTGIHVETFGSGKPLVLVHGWAMHSGVWLDFAKDLANTNKIICVDLPGHGKSGLVSPYNLATIAKALTETIEDKACAWLGWSLGVQVALQVATDFPERVDKLVLLAGTPCFVAKAQWLGMDEKVLDNFAASLMRDCRETLMRFLALQTKGLADHAEILRELKHAVLTYGLPSLETLQAGLQILKTADLRAEFAELKAPVAAILGQLDTLVPVLAGRKMQALRPNLDLTCLDRAGHVPFLTHRSAVVEAVRRFIE